MLVQSTFEITPQTDFALLPVEVLHSLDFYQIVGLTPVQQQHMLARVPEVMEEEALFGTITGETAAGMQRLHFDSTTPGVIWLKSNSMGWFASGFQFACTCENGEEALRLEEVVAQVNAEFGVCMDDREATLRAFFWWMTPNVRLPKRTPNKVILQPLDNTDQVSKVNLGHHCPSRELDKPTGINLLQIAQADIAAS